MVRYQIIYNKRGFPLVSWADDAGTAHKKAEDLRRVGYSVDVWAHTKDSAHKTAL